MVPESDLKPGQWILFFHETLCLPLAISLPFKNIGLKLNDKNIETEIEECCYILMNQSGQLGEYCQRIRMVHGEVLPFDHKVKILTNEQAKLILGPKYSRLEIAAKQCMGIPSAKL